MDLAISLGHNASAALIEKGIVSLAYEEERFSKIKSDSHWPTNAIAEIFKHKQPTRTEKNTLYISHWYDDFNFYKRGIHERIQKHFVPKEVSALLNEYAFKIVTLNENLTHHDAHAWSVLAFLKSNMKEDIPRIGYETLIFVADGFGNRGEVVSIYRANVYKSCKPEFQKINSVHGYNLSLGLMYQYATSFTGMKENEDEYKFLGYESHIETILSEEGIRILGSEASELRHQLIISPWMKQDLNTGFIDLDSLNLVKEMWYKKFDEILAKVSPYAEKDLKNDKEAMRIVIGYLIQLTIEVTMEQIIAKYEEETGIKNICVAGGIFYNVKLNNSIMRATQGKFCVVPLAGDQAGGIGVYYANNPEVLADEFFQGFENLCLGKRDLSPETLKDEYKVNVQTTPPFYFHIIDKKIQFIRKIVDELKKDTLVNVVHSQMEFGPRALCNTSTLALPTKENVELINTLNKRNTVMPMAPVMLRSHLDFFFEDEQYNKVIGSDKFMIITYDYRTSLLYDKYSGVMHKYPLKEVYSDLWKVVEDDSMSIIAEVLRKAWLELGYACLINTSYNVHGVPIVRSINDAYESYEFQQNILKDLKDVRQDKNILLVGNF